MSQINADCLNKIFEHLKDDKVTLHSCLLVSRHWCENAVSFLWSDIWRFQYSTLIACLPDESKDLLSNNGIFIPIPRPSFNYVSFCKVFSIRKIDQMIQNVLEKQQHSITSRYSEYLFSQEILKMFMNQIPSLKSLDYDSGYPKKVENIMFAGFPVAKKFLMNLSELKCSSNIYFEFFYQLSQICHNIQTLSITVENHISDGLTDLIYLQHNLKHVKLVQSCDIVWTDLIPSLTKHSTTLTKLHLQSLSANISISFIDKFENLQELVLSLESGGFDDFNQLQHVKFLQLKVLKFLYECPKVEMLIQFLENNGTNLKELYIESNDNSLNVDIAKTIARSCPNLKTMFMDIEIEALKEVLISCQYLETIKVSYRKGILEVIANYSQKNFCELKIYYNYLEIFPEELEYFFRIWNNRAPLSFIIIKIDTDVSKENVKIIEKYKKLGILKNFEFQIIDDEEANYFDQ